MPTTASASELVDRDTRGARVRVNDDGVALVTYSRPSRRRNHVLYWGGVNESLRFAGHDRSGGWRSRRADWRHFANSCSAYAGPQLPYLVDACTAADGSHWALQSWPRLKRNYGGHSAPHELRLSHWTDGTAELWVKMDWARRGRYHHLYGQLTYRGRPVTPGRTSRRGAVLDGRGRNVLVDALDSDYGRGWRRVNGFLANNPSGQFCFTFAPKRPHSSRTGRSRHGRYRMSVAGPGVSPDLLVSFTQAARRYDRALDQAANAEQRRLRGRVRGGSCDLID